MWRLEDAKQQKLAATMRRWCHVAKTKQAQYTEELESLRQQSEDVDANAALLSQAESGALCVPVVCALCLVWRSMSKAYGVVCTMY